MSEEKPQCDVRKRYAFVIAVVHFNDCDHEECKKCDKLIDHWYGDCECISGDMKND